MLREFVIEVTEPLGPLLKSHKLLCFDQFKKRTARDPDGMVVISEYKKATCGN